jgi:5-methylcytosine-specific restriction endonuclease McrA
MALALHDLRPGQPRTMTRDPRYQTADWRRLSRWVRDRDHNVCQVRGAGCTHHATATDHIVSPLEGGDFWDPANLRATCRHCNSTRAQQFARGRSVRYRTSVATYETRFLRGRTR